MNDLICANCGGYIKKESPTAGFVELKFCNCQKINSSWECLRCHTIHSPYKLSCDCKPIALNQINYTNP